LVLVQPPSVIWATSRTNPKRPSNNIPGLVPARWKRHARSDSHTSNARVASPPSRCAVTIAGLSSRVTVHIPSMPWKTTTPTSPLASQGALPGSRRKRHARKAIAMIRLQ